jgi:hypothetical protein
MAALEAAHTDIGLDWDWDAANGSRQPDAHEMPDRLTLRPQESSVTAKPYQVWTRKGTGSYSVLVPNAKAALAAVNELSGRGHLGVFIKDMDGKDVDLEMLQVIVDLEANPTLRLVRR